MLELKKFVFSPFDVNTYLLWDAASKESVIIDPGCVTVSEKNQLKSFVEDNRLVIKFIINTHCHIDHIFGNKFVVDKFNCNLIAPEEDLFLLRNAQQQAQMFGIEIEESPEPNDFITEELSIKVGEYPLQFIFTPGHTPGEYCIYSEGNKICITGDVLFFEGIGRTDLWRGDYKVLINSIKEKLFTLPDDVTIYPGHGPESTIGHEKKNNPFINN